MGGRLTTAEQIDLEFQLTADRRLDLQALKERERRIAAKIFADQTAHLNPIDILRQWLQCVRSTPSLGSKVIYFLRTLQFFLLGTGAMAGAGLASALVFYDGTTPINALLYLGVMVVLQIGLSVLAAIHLLWRQKLGLLGELTRLLSHSFAKAGLKQSEFLNVFGHGGLVEIKVEKWLISMSLSLFAISFHLAALATFIFTVTFSDLAFSWSTTLAISPVTLESFLHYLALPWQWLGDGWTMSSDQILRTQYLRLESRFLLGDPAAGITAVTLAASQSWWRYLVAAHLMYGLLPRLILGFIAWRQLRRSLRCDILERIEVRAILARLNLGPSNPPSNSRDSAKACPLPPLKYNVLMWRDIPVSETLVRNFTEKMAGSPPNRLVKAGGQDPTLPVVQDFEKNNWLLFVESWESPGKAIKKILTTLAANTGKLIVVPIVVNGDQIKGGDRGRGLFWKRNLSDCKGVEVWWPE